MRIFWRKALPLILCFITLLCLAPVAMAAEEAPEMRSSEDFINVLKEMEGFSATPYWDVNHYSIGYGSTCPSNKVDYYKKNPLTEKQAEELLRSSLTGYEDDVIAFVKKHKLELKQNQFDALVSFTYNCGASWMSELNGNFNTAVRSGDTGNFFLYGICLYSTSAGNYVLINRRLCEANMYINGVYAAYNKKDSIPENYKWVFLNGGGAMPRYPIYAYDAKQAQPIEIRFSSIPTGKTEDGETFTYTFAGWYTEAGKKVSKADSSLSNGQILYARWKDPDGKVVELPTGTPVANQKVTVTASTANMRKGPGTYYAKTGTQSKGAVLTLTETYTVGSTIWGNTNKGWVSLTSNTDYEEKPEVTFPQKGTVNANDVNYRNKPNGTKKGQYDKGTKVTITEVNDAGTWGKMSNGYWIFLDYVTYDKDQVTKVQLIKKPTILEYESYKSPLMLEGSVVLITYADGRQVAQTIARGDVKDNRTATSETAKVTATYGGKSVSFTITFGNGPVKITTQPKNVTVAMGETAKVSVKASGEGLKYRWYIAKPGSSSYTKTDVTTASYSVAMTKELSGSKVYCAVSDKYGNTVKSKAVTIYSKAAVTKQPANASAAIGSKAKTTVQATGEGLKYRWYIAKPGSKTYKKTSDTDSSYSLKVTSSNTGSKVYCLITDKHDNSVKTKAVTLTAKVKLTKQPTGESVAVGKKAAATVKATGIGLKYQWYYANLGSDTFKKSGATGTTYSIKMKDSYAGRRVYCIVTDKYGNTVKSDVVTFTIKTSNANKAKITKQPSDAFAVMGNKVTASVKATGKGLKYAWYYANKGSTSYKKSSATGAKYTVTMNEKHAGRKVYCVVMDQYGNSVKSKTVTLIEKVSIATQPKNVSGAWGSKVTVSVKASGDGLKYAWYYADEGSTTYKKSSATGAEYTVTANKKHSGRKVYCVVTDKYGNSVKTQTATIFAETVITKQPADVQVVFGSEATAFVEAAGKGLTYQWYLANANSETFEKTDITTATYTAVVDEAFSGSKVYCVVTDQYGNTVTSETATLTGINVAETLRKQLEARNGVIEITYQQNTALEGDTALDKLAQDTFYAAVEHTAVPTQGDYLFWQINQLKYSANCVETEGVYNIVLTYTVGYHTTAEKELQVDAKVKEILDTLNVYEATDYEKTKAVYDYLCSTVKVPAFINSSDYTAYGALVNNSAVCQGVASAFYRLMLELDVDVRFISGKFGEINHGWNIVAIDGVYYNVDAAKDVGAAFENYKYFLKADSSLEQHQWGEAYRTEEFMKAYPVSQTDYQ